MRVCNLHGCDVKVFCFLHGNYASTNLKKALSWKTRQVYFICPFPRRLKLGKSLETCRKASFSKNKEWLRIQASCTRLRNWQEFLFYRQSSKQRVLPFFSGKSFYRSNRKLFSCFCISWYKLERAGLGEFSTVMQTLDFARAGLHNCREFTKTLSCLHQVMLNTENIFYCLKVVSLLNCCSNWLTDSF